MMECNRRNFTQDDKDGQVGNLILRDPCDTVLTPQKIVVISILILLNALMLFGNSFSIFIIFRSQNLRRRTYYWLVLNLAVLDLLNAMTVVPLNIIWEYHGNWPFSQPLCDIEIFLDVTFSMLSAYSTMLLSVDKYIYITKPFLYHKYVGPKLTMCSILTIWSASIAYSAASVFGRLARSTKPSKYKFKVDNCNFVLKNSYAIILFVVTFFIPLTIIIFTGSKIFCLARKHIRKAIGSNRVANKQQGSAVFLFSKSQETPRVVDSAISKALLDVTFTMVTPVSSTDVSMLPSIPSDASICMYRGIQAEPPHLSTQGMSGMTFHALGTVILVVIAYVIMFAPFSLAAVVNVACQCVKPYVFEDYLTVFYYMHSLVNPYICIATDRRYKRAIKKISRKSKCFKIFLPRRVIFYN